MCALSAKQGEAGCEKPDGADAARRRLLRIAAYAAPFVLTFGLPESSRAAAATLCPRPSCRCGGACGHP